ncbi:MAG: DUF1902 domain-containing protein [Cellvibrionaceae bacterium]
MESIRIEALWDAEASVWVASSKDVPGLNIEAGTKEELESEIKTLVPIMLQLNKKDADCEYPVEVPIELHQTTSYSIMSSVA